jgi:hypothetical protein
MSLSAERRFDDRLPEICEDIRATLRVSILPTPFRLWSSNPRLLELLWSRLRPNLETRFFECAADAIRKHAARMVWGQPVCHRIDAEEISLFTVQKCRLVINIHHYINPKLLLLVTALVETLRRHDFEPVRDAGLTSSISTGVPAEMPTIHFLEDSSLSQRKRNVLKEIQNILALPEISTEYLGLAYCNGYFEQAWSELKPFAQTTTYQKFAQHLHLMARTLVHGLPFPLEISWNDFASIGMSGVEFLNWIIPAQDALPRLILNMAALKVGMDGLDDASRSPYPV